MSLQTLESTRAWDETRVQPDDADNAADVAEDEFAGAARLLCPCACRPAGSAGSGLTGPRRLLRVPGGAQGAADDVLQAEQAHV